MLIVWAFELLSTVALLYLGATQIVLPLWQGTPLFPMFSSREKQLNQALEDATEELLAAKLEDKIQKRKQEAQKVRFETSPNKQNQHQRKGER